MPCPISRRNYHEIAKKQWRNLKNLLFKNQIGQFQPNLAQSILMWRGFKFVQMKGHALFQEEIIIKLWKHIDKFKKSSLQNHWANFNQTWRKTCFGEGNSSLNNWRAPLFSKRRYLQNSKNTLTNLKKSSSLKPLGLFQPKLGQFYKIYKIITSLKCIHWPHVSDMAHGPLVKRYQI